MEYTEKLSVNKSSSRRINENNLKKNWFEKLSRTGRRRRRRWIIPLENLAIPREKFICSILRPRSRNSPTRKGNDDRSTLSRRAYLLSPLLNLISRRGRSLVNHSVFRDSSSFHSTWNGYELGRCTCRSIFQRSWKAFPIFTAGRESDGRPVKGF